MVSKTKRESRLQPVELEDAGKTEISTEVEVSPNPLPWLTLETLLYIVIFVIAVALRLGRLGAYPLSEVEAQQSLVAWRLYHGDTLQASYYSPLLASLNALSFLLFAIVMRQPGWPQFYLVPVWSFCRLRCAGSWDHSSVC